jgi:hypothetical protein
LFSSRFMPCSECGESVERKAAVEHRCSPDRLVDYQMFELRHDVAKFEARLRRYLHSTAGRFDVWLAARQVRASRY